MYKEKLKELIILGAIGFVIGFFFTLSQDFGFGGSLFMAFFIAGIPYGWKVSGRFLGGLIVVGSLPVMIIAFFLRFVLAMVTGWIAYPIALISTIIKMRKEG